MKIFLTGLLFTVQILFSLSSFGQGTDVPMCKIVLNPPKRVFVVYRAETPIAQFYSLFDAATYTKKLILTGSCRGSDAK